MFYARIHGNLLDTLFLGNGKYQTAISAGPSLAGAPVFPNILSSGSGLPGGYHFAAVRRPEELPRSLLAAGNAGPRAPVHPRYRGHRQLHLEPRHRHLHAARSEPRQPGRPLHLHDPGRRRQQRRHLHHAGLRFQPRLDKRYGKILQVENGGQSWYNALALQVVKRFSHGLTAQINYTWSHAIDDANQQGASWNISSTFNNATFNGNYPLDKGSSTLDQRHRASINWLWKPDLHHEHIGFRQVLRQRMGTFRHHHAGQRASRRARP